MTPYKKGTTGISYTCTHFPRYELRLQEDKSHEAFKVDRHSSSHYRSVIHHKCFVAESDSESVHTAYFLPVHPWLLIPSSTHLHTQSITKTTWTQHCPSHTKHCCPRPLPLCAIADIVAPPPWRSSAMRQATASSSVGGSGDAPPTACREAGNDQGWPEVLVTHGPMKLQSSVQISPRRKDVPKYHPKTYLRHRTSKNIQVA